MTTIDHISQGHVETGFEKIYHYGHLFEILKDNKRNKRRYTRISDMKQIRTGFSGYMSTMGQAQKGPKSTERDLWGDDAQDTLGWHYR